MHARNLNPKVKATIMAQRFATYTDTIKQLIVSHGFCSGNNKQELDTAYSSVSDVINIFVGRASAFCIIGKMKNNSGVLRTNKLIEIGKQIVSTLLVDSEFQKDSEKNKFQAELARTHFTIYHESLANMKTGTLGQYEDIYMRNLKK